ncbi:MULTISPECIES: hypothetical protein [Pseudomonas]|uniref:hypothetical protein n=1 Tax=Pseudomonas TaxID=286 RepID=UPI0010C14B05|nr:MULTISPECIES: hypothetical protein [Pseudomonas]
MSVHDFNAAALRAYKKRQRKGALEILNADSPLLAAAMSDPETEVIDADWMGEILEQLSPVQQHTVRQGALAGAHARFGAPNFSQVCLMGYLFLRHLERIGVLDQWRQKP